MDITETDVEALLKEGEAVMEQIQKFSDQGIPNNLSEAVETGIDLAVEAAEGAILVHYPKHERDEDRKRVIRMDVALRLMQELEEEYLTEVALGGYRAVWGILTGFYLIIYECLTAIWAALKTFNLAQIQAALARVWWVLLKNLFMEVGIAEVAVPLRRALVFRARFDRKMRLAALKQRTNVKRVWRRKRTRT